MLTGFFAVFLEIGGLLLVLLGAVPLVDESLDFNGLFFFPIKKHELFGHLLRILPLQLIEVLLSMGPCLSARA